MGLLNKRASEPTVDAILARALFGETTVEQAMNIPAFAASVDWISNKVAALPIKLYHEDGEETTEIVDDVRLKCLNDESYNDTMTAYEMKSGMVRDYLLHGRGYAYIDWSRNTVAGLHYIRAPDVSYNAPIDPIHRATTYLVGGKQYEPYKLLRLLRHTQDGVNGKSVIDENKEVLAVAYTTLLFEKKLISSGGCRKAYITSDKPMSEKALESLKEAWQRIWSLNGDAAVAMDSGVKVQEAASSPVELQMNENKLVNSGEIYEIFGLSPEIIRGTATDEQIAHAVQNSVVPIITAFESVLNRNLLLESEKKNHYFAFDLKELLKGDIVKRYQAYQIALQSNFMQLDEVRYAEDLKPLGFELIKFGLSDVFYNVKTKQFYTPNTNKQTAPGGEPIEPDETPT